MEGLLPFGEVEVSSQKRNRPGSGFRIGIRSFRPWAAFVSEQAIL